MTATVSTAIPVVMLAWIVMPYLTRLLDAWLYAGTDAIRDESPRHRAASLMTEG